MKSLLGLVIVAVLVFGAVPAYSGDAVQMWKCEMDDDATEEQIKGNAAKWLKAAKTMPGGENLQAFVLFPIAVNGVGEMDLMFVVVAPSFEDWGKFWDAYADSAANAADELNADNVVCPDSVLWESYTVE
jgi:hypothetical protein